MQFRLVSAAGSNNGPVRRENWKRVTSDWIAPTPAVPGLGSGAPERRLPIQENFELSEAPLRSFW